MLKSIIRTLLQKFIDDIDAEQIVKHGKKLMHCLSELESKSGERYMERYGKRRRGGMRDSDYDDEDYPRYY